MNEKELDINLPIIGDVTIMTVPNGIDQSDAWNKLLRNISRNEIRGSLTLRTTNISMYVVAASIVFIIGLGIFFCMLLNEKTVVCQKGQQLIVLLPDESKVTLNSSSTLRYKRFGWTHDRSVSLKGEAFFSVTKGNSFTVHTEQGIINVLGTNFDVFARNSTLNVICKTGKVMVKVSHQKVILLPGDGCLLAKDAKQLVSYKPDIAKQSDWIGGRFWFDNVSLSEVFKEMERQYNVNISYNDTTERFYTGCFTNKNINEALQVVCLPMQLQYNMMNTKHISIKNIQQ